MVLEEVEVGQVVELEQHCTPPMIRGWRGKVTKIDTNCEIKPNNSVCIRLANPKDKNDPWSGGALRVSPEMIGIAVEEIADDDEEMEF